MARARGVRTDAVVTPPRALLPDAAVPMTPAPGLPSIVSASRPLEHRIDRAYLLRVHCDAGRDGERWDPMATSARPPSDPAARRTALIRRRTAQGLSQERLAEQLGVDRTTIARWESGTSTPQPWQRPNLAQALGVTLAECDALLVLAPPTTAATTVQAESSGQGDGDEMDRRVFLTTTMASAVSVPSRPGLIDALLQPPQAEALTLNQLSAGVQEVKTAYQACRYDDVAAVLARLLPAVRSSLDRLDSSQLDAGHALATDLYHVAGSVFLKLGDPAIALLAAERSGHHAARSGDPIAEATSARVLTHALVASGHNTNAVAIGTGAATRLKRATGLREDDALSAYGALLLRSAVAAGRTQNRDTAEAILDEAKRAGEELGHDGNDRWTGFGPTNVQQHRVHLTLAFGDAGTAVEIARRVPLDKIPIAERRGSLFLDVAKAYAMWGRHEQALNALHAALKAAPGEVNARPATARLIADLAALARGHTRARVVEFAGQAGIRL
ncbi:helix-turn-helix transcriptional regulator [Catellatospora sp. NPDC049111]|uniref:helix-turn-helix transcriptional regulator n=1 Tax=Catellatospora sp. NPDC049111 TaxID=3155271 RepID=UPI0033F3B03B